MFYGYRDRSVGWRWIRYAGFSFSCTPGGDGLTFTYEYEPVEAYDGVEVEVLLQAGDIEVPIRTFGRLPAPDGAFILEGKIGLDDRLIDLITSRGRLHVTAEDGARAYSLDGAREAAAPLIESCRGQTVDADAIDIRSCTISAWSTDTDPDGLNIRAGPGIDHPIIGRIPPPSTVGNDEFAAEVSITGSKDGWFRIDRALSDVYIVEDGPTLVFEGEGWVSGRFLGLDIEGRYLLQRPAVHNSAPVAFDFSEHPDGYRTVDRLHACVGYWVDVEGDVQGSRFRGWTTDTCPSQVTTCP